ncbi:unnamed protein product [Discula destructiva]
MEVQFPAPFKSKYNPNTPSGSADYSMTAPLLASGADFPCKGYQSVLGTPAGAPTATFAVGGKGNMTITGGAAHGGGSCQISLSTDGAKTFTVLQSIIGSCPASGTSNLDFTIPADAPAGDHVLAWTWHNEIGNREMYMNCAAVTLITGDAGVTGGMRKMARAAAYAARPGIFIANVGPAGGGCTTQEDFDVEYPEPGPDVTNDSSKAKTPSCGVTQQVGSGAGSAPPVSGGGGSGSGYGGGGNSSAPPGPLSASTPTPSAQPAATFQPAPSTGLPSGTGSGSGLGSGSGSGSGSGAGSDAGSAQPAVPTSISNGASSSGNAPGSACPDEGAWACFPGGGSFQRCASGTWSLVMSMAPGTTCNEGTSSQMETLAVVK